MAIAVAFAAATRPSCPVGLAFTRQKTRWVFSPLASSSYSAQPPSSPSSRRKQLILYSKPGCCLCDGLKEKIQASFFLSGTPHSLHDVDLQVPPPHLPLFFSFSLHTICSMKFPFELGLLIFC